MNARIVIDPNTSHPAAVRIQCLFNFFLPSQNSSGIIHTSNTCGLREYHDGKGTYHSTSVAVLLPIDDDMMGTATATTVDCMLNRASLYDESSEFNSSETAGCLDMPSFHLPYLLIPRRWNTPEASQVVVKFPSLTPFDLSTV
jgi:hypothetical protein